MPDNLTPQFQISRGDVALDGSYNATSQEMAHIEALRAQAHFQLATALEIGRLANILDEIYHRRERQGEL